MDTTEKPVVSQWTMHKSWTQKQRSDLDVGRTRLFIKIHWHCIPCTV